jgi:hypothetical protein
MTAWIICINARKSAVNAGRMAGIICESVSKTAVITCAIIGMTCVIAAVNTGEVIINQLKETIVPNPECLRDFGNTVFDVELRRNEEYPVFVKADD